MTGTVCSGGGHHSINFCDVISLPNLFCAWRKFRQGKSSKEEVATFELCLEENLFNLHSLLASDSWKPDPYIRFCVSDPKPRIIHKASVRDRVLYQALYQSLYQILDREFIHDSYASRSGKGTHRGVIRFRTFSRKITSNHTRNAFVLKCDIRKFFDCIDHKVLLSLIAKRISDEKLLALIVTIVRSFQTEQRKGLPLGNVTSQLFANIYLNELDQFNKPCSSYPRCRADGVLGEQSFILRTSRFSTPLKQTRGCSPQRGNSRFLTGTVHSLALEDSSSMSLAKLHVFASHPDPPRIHPRELCCGEFCVLIKPFVRVVRSGKKKGLFLSHIRPADL